MMAFNPLPDPDSNAQQRHLRFIESIAEEMRCSIQEIAPLYEEVLKALSIDARIDDYLPIFVSKRVKGILRRQTRPGDVPRAGQFHP